MCGIFLQYSGNTSDNNDDLFFEFDELASGHGPDIIAGKILGNEGSLLPLIADRGPNYASLKYSKEDHICWFSSVLSLREPLTKQSISVGTRFVLQYNGECYNKSIKNNDTQWIVDQLTICEDVPAVLRSLDGEFAYTIYDKHMRQVFFGRDAIGKRSLSYRWDPKDKECSIASVTGKIEGFENCVAGVIYVYDVAQNEVRADLKIRPDAFRVSNEEDRELVGLDDYVSQLYDLLKEAVQRRIDTIHPLHIENSPVSVLFSGGLDCSVIAALVCQYIKNSNQNTILELLNVGFENPRTGLMPGDVPDRILGLKSYLTLKKLFPEVTIRFLEVDVSFQDFLDHKGSIMNLIYPKQTEMDLSIAAAFYFAARGRGFIKDDSGARISYNRNGVVLFSGLGADELYGGYHKFANKSKQELVGELERQINNIHDRNLSRDDKVVASNGVEVRYPFLDEAVVEFSTGLPITYKVNKMILRKLAQERLFMSSISEEPKRAIQFGAKSAKMTKNGNKHGTDVVAE
ncbi:LADA_0D12904g1_1 [Lachancea dasiensis]|uniref:LADA_0D12904g1_1 n=1 Tax=Lachancea dasiensis TaxID=1072105 RepID=A0A1G4J8P1_9SACH|nr:LADA_0D12904g1_1 [Lachancea dasiensis]